MAGGWSAPTDGKRASGHGRVTTAISRMLVGAGLGITALVPEQQSLESFFFELTEGEPVEAVA